MSDYEKEQLDRWSRSQPKLVGGSGESQVRKVAQELLPEGVNLDPPMSKEASLDWDLGHYGFYGAGGGGMGNAFYHYQRPYLPEMATPDRMQYPRDRKRANAYWRLFQKTDPIFGTAMEMYSEMAISDFDLVFDDSETSAEEKSVLEYMCETTNIQERLKYMVREYLGIGEAIPHNFFDDDLGIWTYISLHNPDYIDVKDVPIVDMEPVLSFLPDESVRRLLADNSPEALEMRRRLPAEFVSKILAHQKIRLSSDNCTFIPRKMHPYEVRGTSIASRLWRIFMIEDAVYSSTEATYRRNAAPIRALLYGDPATHWIPDPDEIEPKLTKMLAQAEADPAAWILHNYGLKFEAWGTTNQAISIKNEHDIIEKVKLLGLGLTRSFLQGESTYASAKAGIQVFLRRLLALRQFWESVWIMPRFFRPVVEMNEWVKTTPSEVSHGYRMKRTAQEIAEKNLLVMPKLHWNNKLDPTVDTDFIQAAQQLERLGIKISKGTICAQVGIDYEDELQKSLREFKREEDEKKQTLGDTLQKKFEQAKPGGAAGGAAGGGAPGGGVPSGGAKPPGGPGAGAKPPSVMDTGAPGSGGEKGPLNDKIEPFDQGDMSSQVE